MATVHHLYYLLRDTPCVLLLYELRKNAFQIRQAHQIRKIGGASVGQYSSLRNHDDAIANLLDHFKHVRNVEDRFAPVPRAVQEGL